MEIDTDGSNEIEYDEFKSLLADWLMCLMWGDVDE